MARQIGWRKETSFEPQVVSSGERIGSIMLQYGPSIDNNFISENGIVAELGDEGRCVRLRMESDEGL